MDLLETMNKYWYYCINRMNAEMKFSRNEIYKTQHGQHKF